MLGLGLRLGLGLECVVYSKVIPNSLLKAQIYHVIYHFLLILKNTLSSLECSRGTLDWNDMVAEYEERQRCSSSMSWGEIVEMAEMDGRPPGYALHMHEKLSSPSRKRYRSSVWFGFGYMGHLRFETRTGELKVIMKTVSILHLMGKIELHVCALDLKTSYFGMVFKINIYNVY